MNQDRPMVASDPGYRYKAVTKSDSTNIQTDGSPCRGLWVGGAGDVAVVGVDDVAVTLVGVPAGTMLSCRAKRVNSTNTTATSIVALY